jgi:hypothetical protein
MRRASRRGCCMAWRPHGGTRTIARFPLPDVREAERRAESRPLTAMGRITFLANSLGAPTVRRPCK